MNAPWTIGTPTDTGENTPQSSPGTPPSGDSTPIAPVLPPLSPTACRNAYSVMTIRATATIGAVNRPGNSAPRVNARAQTAASPRTPTTTGAMGGPPQVACCEVRT